MWELMHCKCFLFMCSWITQKLIADARLVLIVCILQIFYDLLVSVEKISFSLNNDKINIQFNRMYDITLLIFLFWQCNISWIFQLLWWHYQRSYIISFFHTSNAGKTSVSWNYSWGFVQYTEALFSSLSAAIPSSQPWTDPGIQNVPLKDLGSVSKDFACLTRKAFVSTLLMLTKTGKGMSFLYASWCDGKWSEDIGLSCRCTGHIPYQSSTDKLQACLL